MVALRHVTTCLDAPKGFLTGISDLGLVNGKLQVMTGMGGGLLVLDPAQGLAVSGTQAHFYTQTTALTGPVRAESMMSGGVPALVTGGPQVGGFSLFTLDAGGGVLGAGPLRHSGTVSPTAISAIEEVVSGGISWLVTASRQSAGLTAWSVDAKLRMFAAPQQSAAAALLPAGGVAALAEVARAGTSGAGAAPLVLALSAGSEGLTSYTLSGSGQFEIAGRLDARDGLYISGAQALETVRLAGQDYALIGAAGSGSLAVAVIGTQGQMRLTDHVLDERDTRFAGLTDIATATVGGQVFIAAGGADDGVSLFTLLPGGRLVHLATLADDMAMALTNAGALTMRGVETAGVEAGGGARLELFVAGLSPDAPQGGAITQLAADLGQIGEVLTATQAGGALTGGAGRDLLMGGAGADLISGGAGEDILADGAGADVMTGGAGADLFILTADGQTDRITDFERGIDRLDLSQLGRFYRAEDVDLRATATGCEIRFGPAELLVIQSADGKSLTREDFPVSALRDLTHLVMTPPLYEPGTLHPRASPGPDYLDGRSGPDSLIGGGGHDTLAGQAGNDLLCGDGGHGVDARVGQIFRLYQATLARAPDPTGLATWCERLAGGTSLVTAAAGFTGSKEFLRSYGETSNEGFVTLLYQNVLGRAPDAAGLAAWTAALTQGRSTRPEVVVGFSESAEFVARSRAALLSLSTEGCRQDVVDDVFRLYRATLGRDPDPTGLTNWSNALGDGMALSKVIAGFVQSREFTTTYGALDDTAFVTLLYQNVLGRAPDALGLSSWLSALSSARLDRAGVVAGFAQSREFVAATAAPLKAWLRAQGEDDWLGGGAGDDTLFGGRGADVFHFHADEDGRDVVADFEPWDFVALEGFGYRLPSEARAHLSQQGSAVVFEDQGVSISFLDSTLASFTDDVFIL